MLNTNEAECRPDLMAVHMKKAADDRGFPNSFQNLQSFRQRSALITWLCFEVGPKNYYYANGTLLAAGGDKWGGIGHNINHGAEVLVADKQGTKDFLSALGYSVPEGRFFRRRHLDEAIRVFDSISKPVCVKPNNSSLGRYIYPAIETRQWYENALRRVAEKKPNILVEESVSGHHFRFFYVYPEVVAIRLGVPFHVVGDGTSTITDLLKARNDERRRRALPTHPPFEVDQVTLDFLAMQGIEMDDVPPIGQTVYLRGASNGPAGADTFLLDKDEIHPSYCAIVEQVCKSMTGLYISGVDMIVKDMKQPARNGNYWILELNTNPAISAYYYPWKGKIVDVAGIIMDFMMEHPDFM